MLPIKTTQHHLGLQTFNYSRSLGNFFSKSVTVGFSGPSWQNDSKPSTRLYSAELKKVVENVYQCHLSNEVFNCDSLLSIPLLLRVGRSDRYKYLVSSSRKLPKCQSYRIRAFPGLYQSPKLQKSLFPIQACAVLCAREVFLSRDCCCCVVRLKSLIALYWNQDPRP